VLSHRSAYARHEADAFSVGERPVLLLGDKGAAICECGCGSAGPWCAFALSGCGRHWQSAVLGRAKAAVAQGLVAARAARKVLVRLKVYCPVRVVR
jgi:hypothetical protein